jgi:hypothetical protein
MRNKLRYDPETGDFFWLIDSPRTKIGQKAGWPNDSGYRLISVNGRKYRAHHLAWYFIYGVFPTNQLDHINGIRDDNRISNLREATDAQNRQNMAKRSDNKSGYIGVYWAAWANKWRAEIAANGVKRKLGYFNTIDDAVTAYLAAKAKIHQFHPTPVTR